MRAAILRKAAYLIQVAALALLVTLSGCHAERPRQADVVGRGNILHLVDSIRLVEPDSAIISRPGWFGVAPDGRIFVTERFTARVFQYAPDGSFVHSFGRKGDGPGEFRNPFAIGFNGDTAAVFDVGHRRLDRYLANGQYLAPSITVPLNVNDIVGIGGRLWLGGVDVTDDVSVMEFVPRDSSLRRRLGLPRDYQQQPLLELMGGAHLDAAGDKLVIGFGAADSILLLDAGPNTVVRALKVPRRVRRGFPDRVREQAVRGDGMALLNGASVLAGVGWLPGDTAVAVLFKDLTRQKVGFTGDYWLSIVRVDGLPVCVDVPVPLGMDEAPKWNFRGDTLLILSQPIRDSATVETWVRKFVIDPTGQCPG